ncbi:hypothetical protein BKA80DRAFT_107289 [Phyllosticta citrichinensis]
MASGPSLAGSGSATLARGSTCYGPTTNFIASIRTLSSTSFSAHRCARALSSLSLLPSLATNTIFEISHPCHSSNSVPNSCVAPASLLTSLARSQPSQFDSPRLGSRPFSHARSHAAPDFDVLDS